MSESKIIKVGITHGDINGVGYEVILKTLSDPRIVELCTPVLYGSAKVAAYHRKALDSRDRLSVGTGRAGSLYGAGPCYGRLACWPD